jgi:hypothetical protein
MSCAVAPKLDWSSIRAASAWETTICVEAVPEPFEELELPLPHAASVSAAIAIDALRQAFHARFPAVARSILIFVGTIVFPPAVSAVCGTPGFPGRDSILNFDLPLTPQPGRC